MAFGFQKYMFLSLLLFSLQSRSQESSPKMDVLADVKERGTGSFQEKVHIHFDRQFYAVGDTAWFKGYIVYGEENIPSDKSSVLHIDLIDATAKVRKNISVPIHVGFARGYFSFPDSLEGGSYLIRGYTENIIDSKRSGFFKKILMLIDKSPEKDQLTIKKISGEEGRQFFLPAKDTKYNIETFPKGQGLVDGLANTVGIKVIDDKGFGIRAKGRLVDQSDRLIDTFSIMHSGIGSITFTPKFSSTYSAEITFSDSTKKKIDLQDVRKNGYSIWVRDGHADTLSIVLEASNAYINGNEIIFLPLSEEGPLFEFKTRFPDRQINLDIPRYKLPNGILNLMIINEKKELEAERLVFNWVPGVSGIEILNRKKSYKKKSLIELEVQVRDKFGKPVPGSFSVSVNHSDNLPFDEVQETSILSDLLLTANLDFPVQKPNYYFTAPLLGKDKELNELLLTHRNDRSFFGKKLVNGPEHPKGFEFNGRIVSKSKTNLGGIKITLLIGSLTHGLLIDTLTDDKGRFVFMLPDSLIYEPMRIDVNGRSNIEYQIIPDNNFVATIDERYVKSLLSPTSDPSDVALLQKYMAISADNRSKKLIQNRSIGLAEVKISGNRSLNKLPKNSHSVNLNGPGGADQIFTGEILSKLTSMGQIYSLLTGVDPYGNLWSNVGTNNPKVLLLVDGTEGFSLGDINPGDVESVEFMKSAGYIGTYGIKGSGGVLLITTKRGSNSGDAALKNSVSLPPLFQKQVVFTAPKFNDAPSAQQELGKTLYWNPDLITDVNGRVTLKFLNSTQPGAYSIIFEGITSTGEVFRKTFTYQVE
ncbi:hypothetical protein DU508_17065 [Pedobacter chinensis]|uniref:TonB-dependent receptor plug domain-containing protein n=1 Tax=Pedobacter chinensis TaxID=2282421 RepID=A0A369PVM6_9SPHI|nr:hypothetical protein [Pedobacter chinensis]RDC55285.1 hypothetical protein DU508_17065 [Pedobacter chinensis]